MYGAKVDNPTSTIAIRAIVTLNARLAATFNASLRLIHVLSLLARVWRAASLARADMVAIVFAARAFPRDRCAVLT